MNLSHGWIKAIVACNAPNGSSGAEATAVAPEIPAPVTGTRQESRLQLDMYEHAYHMDYGAVAGKYVDAFTQNLNWEEVDRRAEATLK